jgi:hypothetical protein
MGKRYRGLDRRMGNHWQDEHGFFVFHAVSLSRRSRQCALSDRDPAFASRRFAGELRPKVGDGMKG